ncbi:filamentous hemagglutinin-like protein [Kalymmatonema gypsitolerans NIES-4073]|nr:filamentous hemagglutinin-like protein [Scytonema sp. NIES-4073]
MSEMNTRWRWFLRLGITYCGALGTAVAQIFPFSVNSTLAQELKPIADDSLGAESSVVTPTSAQVDRIDGGAIRGTNLFHSFSQFHIGEGREAYFANPSGIQNILSRVTGSDASKIFGKLGVLGNANLFLINPNGIIFGPKASLDIRGSFVASTASSLKFADDFEFSATAPQATPLLSVSVPIGLQYGGTAGGIRVQGSSLEVQPGNTLALVGGDVTLQGGNLGGSETANLAAPGGRIELGSVAGVGEVSLNHRGNSWVLGYDRVNTFSNIRLENGAFVDASGSGGGDIQIQGARLELTQNSFIFADTLDSEDGGEVLVRSTEAITLKEGSLITADNLGSGTGGNLTIETAKLIVQDRSRVAARTLEGQGGNLTVRASKSVELIGKWADGQVPPGVYLDPFAPNSDTGGLFTGSFGTGDAGNLTIATEKLTVRDGAALATNTLGEGRGGNLTVNASDSVEVMGLSFLTTETRDAGAAGNLTIKTGNLLVRDDALVSAETGNETGDNKGQGGRLEVTAADSVKLIDTGILSTTSLGSGNAGPLTITTGKLLIQNGSAVTASALGEGRGGNLTVNVKESVELSNEPGFAPSGLVTSTIVDAKGDAGNITISTGKLTIKDGASVRAQTLGEGRGGNLSVTARELVELIGTSADGQDPSGLFTSNSTIGGNTNPTGTAGDITIATGKLIVRDGAQINVSSEGTANAGNLQIHARSIHLDNQAKLTAQTASGNGGNIILQNRDLLLLRRGSLISATAGTAGAGGDGGNITINAPNGFIVTVPDENSDITANAFNGNGGQVTINATAIFGMIPRSREDLVKLLQTNDPNQLDPARLLTNDISAISQANASLNGVVTINTPDVDPNRGLVQLPTNLVDASQQIATGCTPRHGQTSSFVATGRGGLPLSPSEPLRSRAVVTQWVTLDEQTGNQGDGEVKPVESSEHPADNREPIVEANGWVVDKKGDVYLVAQVPNATSSFQTTTASCLTRN